MHGSRIITTCSTIDEEFCPVEHFTAEQPCKKHNETDNYGKGKHTWCLEDDAAVVRPSSVTCKAACSDDARHTLMKKSEEAFSVLVSDEIHKWCTKYINGIQGLRKALLNRPVDMRADWTGPTKSLPDSFAEVVV